MKALSDMRRLSFRGRDGFTIVELLIVIVIIAILASITVGVYNGVQDRARQSAMKADLSNLNKAILAARANESKVLKDITGRTWTAGNCASKAAGTDLAGLARTDPCWAAYLDTLSKISVASGINVKNLVDPWGRPYYIDENEGDSGSCSKDSIDVFSIPINASTKYTPSQEVRIPLSGLTGCA